MNTSKLFLMGTLLLMLFMLVPAMAGIPTLPFTGEADNDFDPTTHPGILVIPDPGGPNEITVQVEGDPNIYTSGWDIKDLRLGYDAVNDILYVALNSYGIIGDVDGDGNEATLTHDTGGFDFPLLSNNETAAVYFDLDMQGPFIFNSSWDVIIGVGADPMSFFDFGIYNTDDKSAPGSNFGTRIVGHDGVAGFDWPDTTVTVLDTNDFEFAIRDFSTLLKDTRRDTNDVFPAQFRVGAFMGTDTDGDVGEDYIYYHQIPSTVVTILAPMDVNEGETVNLVVMEENKSEAIRSQLLGPAGAYIDVPIGFSSVQVEVRQGSEDPPSPFVELSWSPLHASPDGGDDGNDVLDSPVPDVGIIPGETWIWGTITTLTSNSIMSDSNDFIASASGIDRIGFLHNFEVDVNEVNAISVHAVSEPNIAVVKTVDCEVTMPGYPVNYTICIQNTGPVDVIPTLIYDDKLGDLTADFIANCTIPLPPDANCCLTFGPYYEVLGDPNTNTVTFDANDLSGNAAPTATDEATVTIVDPNFTVEKICLTDPVEDANACFRIIITNIGDVNLVVITDEPTLPGPLPLPAFGQPIDVNICVPVPPDVNEVCNTITVEATIDEPNYICLDGLVLPPKDANDCCPVPPPGGGEGCTPGFWKNNADKHDASAWCDLFDPDKHISDYFELDDDLVIFTGGNPNKSSSYITDPTLLQALGANGGGVNAMIRHGIAAMLNACSNCVNYPNNDPIEIILMIEETLNGEPGAFTIDELHFMFAGYNESVCPINQHGDCSHPLLDFMN